MDGFEYDSLRGDALDNEDRQVCAACLADDHDRCEDRGLCYCDCNDHNQGAPIR